MTSTPSDGIDPRTEQTLAAATQELRGRRHPRAVEVANDVIAQALRSSRRSLPVHLGAPHDFVWVSDQVVIDRLRRRIDQAAVRGAAVGRIYVQATPDATLREVTIELYVRYGEVLMDAADQVRVVAAPVLRDLLGAPTEVTVVPTHVHISDVTRGDPHLVDPRDEGG